MDQKKESFRKSILDRVDALLGMWVVRGEDRKLLTALRKFTADMAYPELDRFAACLDLKPVKGSDMVPFDGLLQLPTSPMAGVNVLISYFKGEEVPAVEVGHAALHIVAFAYGIIDDQHKAVMKSAGDVPCVCPCKEECLAVLEGVKAKFDAVGVGAAADMTMDWKAMLRVALPLIFQFLNQLLS